MRFAYADPPYLGCGKFYPEHPEALRWDQVGEHVALIARLDADYDGWAMSASAPSLQPILTALGRAQTLQNTGPDFRIASWVKPFAAFMRNVRIAYTWEPVLFKPGRDSSRDGAPVGRDHLSESISLKRGLTGAKPAAFCRWVLTLLGYIEGDELVDMFPGTGVMSAVAAQGILTPALSQETVKGVTMYDAYEDAVERAKSLRPLVHAPWTVTPVGSPEEGYRLALFNDDEPTASGYLASDEDVKRLLELYVERVKALSQETVE